MRKIALSLAVISAILLPALYAAPAHAQNTWVAGTGSDANPCTRTSPCASLNAALALTGSPGEAGYINCLNPGDFSGSGPPSVTITKSVTIDCHEVFGAVRVCAGTTRDAILINAPGAVVILRNLDIDSLVVCAGAIGVHIQAAATVYIEDCVVENFGARGISDERTTGETQLFIKNTVVRNNTSVGIVVAAAPKNTVVLENVQSLGNGYGIAVATGNNVVISRSVMSGNGIAGIEADPGAQVAVDNTEISHNGSYGVQAFGTVTLANSDIAFNTSSISGATMSFGNNRLVGNGGGTAPTPVGQQ
jgi:Right handed beta helix region